MALKQTPGVTPLSQSTNLDLVTLQQTIGAGFERDPLHALSQRKLNALGLAIAYIDSDQRYRFANKAFLDWLGKQPNEVHGRQLSEVLGTEVYEFYRAKLETALKGEPAGFECQLTRPGRPPVWIRVDYYPDRSPRGRIRGLLATYTDVDHLKRLEQDAVAREHQLRTFSDNLPEPVIYLDRELRYVFANESFLRLMGLAHKDVIGKPTREVMGAEATMMLTSLYERALRGEASTYERSIVDPHGRLRWISGRIVPDPALDGSIKGLYVVGHDITDLKKAQQALAARESQLRAIMDGVPAPVAYVDPDERCHYVNRPFLQYFGMSADQLPDVRLHDALGPEVYEDAQPLLQRALQGEATAFDRLVAGANGVGRWMTIRIVPNAAPSGSVDGAFVLMNDIHGLKQAQEALGASEAEMRLIMDNVPARVSYIDRDYRYRFLNRHNEVWLGANRQALAGCHVAEVVGEKRAQQLQPILEKVLNGETVSTDLLLAQPTGDLAWESVHYAPNRDSAGRVIGIYAVHTDIHDQKQAEERLQYMATRDALTGLPNRLLLQDRLEQAIAHARRSGRRVGVMFIDLDRFKNVNDTLGHRIGDELLKSVTAALSASLREVDLLARLGGDEFMVIVEDVDDPAALGLIAEKLLDAMAKPFRIEEHQIYVTASIGISVYPDDSDDPEELLKHADVAMYRSKELGRNTYQFLDADVADRRLKQHALESALRVALKEDALALVYQPMAGARDGAIVGAEALLRWSDPVHGDVLPRIFIPLAEESGLIHALGDWVLGKAAAQCAAWRSAGLALTVSVNLSPRQFHRDDLGQRMLNIVRGAGCDPAWIELEVTETSLLHDLDAIHETLGQLRGEGFSVAIDDFGTGYSSLTHLKHFPLDSLKIDVSFIADLETDAGDAAITEAIIGLARGLGLRVVAEGVGSRAQLDFLRARGCDLVQGFWISRPLTPRDIEAYVQAGASALCQKFES